MSLWASVKFIFQFNFITLLGWKPIDLIWNSITSCFSPSLPKSTVAVRDRREIAGSVQHSCLFLVIIAAVRSVSWCLLPNNYPDSVLTLGRKVCGRLRVLSHWDYWLDSVWFGRECRGMLHPCLVWFFFTSHFIEADQTAWTMSHS